ncbi:CST complex subunit ctc1 [Geranomyces variabilis]|uniref:CST complex subunit CTC1 n=1 Tax=Geranomyces variabilis TaxID=109894 RepID=A0AAD5TJ47_9FUNG|nr:CST complex subunit ctc1 [Geranomyces variabilis]
MTGSQPARPVSPTAYYRIRRLQELLLSLPAKDASSSAAAQGNSSPSTAPATPTPVLVGRFLTKRDAECLHPNADLSAIAGAICFCDSTGVVPCEFSGPFDVRWMGRNCCLRFWSLVPMRYWTAEETLPTANEPTRGYLEVSGSPFFLPVAHFLIKPRSYEFDSIDCDLDAELYGAEPLPLPSARYTAFSSQLGIYKEVADSSDGESGTSPLSLPAVVKTRRLSITATVHAKSTLGFPRGQTCFFVELGCVIPHADGAPRLPDHQTLLTVFVLYSGATADLEDILPYYETVRVGQRYLFTDLKASAVVAPGAQPGSKGNKMLLLFSLGSSKLFPLNVDAFAGRVEAAAAEEPAPCTDTAASDHALVRVHAPVHHVPSVRKTRTAHSSRPSFIISYSGRITAILDIQAGIYELDSRNWLYLTFHYLHGLGRGLRVGAKLDLHNVHLLSNVVVPRPQHDEATAQLGSAAKPRQLVLVACAYSAVRVKAFAPEPPLHMLCTAAVRKQAAEVLCSVNVPDLLIARVIYACFTAAEAVVMGPAGVGTRWDLPRVLTALAHFGYTPFEDGVFLATVLDHDEGCRLATWRYPVPDIVGVTDLIARVDRYVAERDDGLATDDHVSPQMWSHRVITCRQLGLPTTVLVGLLIGDSNELHLHDAFGKIRVVADAALHNDLAKHLDRLVLVKKFSVLRESLAIVPGTGGGNNHASITAVRVRASDIVELGDWLQRPAPPISDLPAMRRVFLLQHASPRTAHLTGNPAEPFTTSRLYEGVSWMLADDGRRLQEPIGRPTFIEIPDDENQNDAYSWHLDTFHVVTNMATAPGTRNAQEASALYLKFASGSHTSLFIVPDRANPLPAAELALLQAFQSRSGPRTYRSVGAVVTRHAESLSPVPDHLANVTGTLVHRGLRPPERSDALLMNKIPWQMFMERGVGLARSDRILLLRLGDADGGEETLDVYIDLRMRSYPVGMVLGATLKLGRVALCTSARGTLYAQAVPETSITVQNDESAIAAAAAAASVGPLSAPLITFTAFYDDANASGQPRRVKCGVTFISTVKMTARCASCLATGFPDGACPNGCAPRHAGVDASARAWARDGTAEAVLYVDGFEAVMALMRAVGGGGALAAVDEAREEAKNAGLVLVELTPPWFTPDADTATTTTFEPGISAYEVGAAGYGPAAPSRLETVMSEVNARGGVGSVASVVLVCRRSAAASNKIGSNVAPVLEDMFRRRTFRTGDGKVWPTVARKGLALKVLGAEKVSVVAEAARLVAWFKTTTTEGEAV